MVSFVTTRDEISKIVSERGGIGLGAILCDLGFDLGKPMKLDTGNGKVEFWQPEDDLLITPSMPVINGSQRKAFNKNRFASLLRR